MTLIAGFKTPHDILFREDLKRWENSMDVILTVDCAEEDVACHVGLVTQYIPQIKLGNVQSTVAVVVGPPAMMRFSVQGLLNIGVFCQALFPEKSVKIPCFHRGIFPIFSGYCLCIPTHESVFHPVTFSFENQQMSMVDKTVNHSCRHLVICKNTAPFGKLQVCS